MLKNILMISLGASIGACSRYFLSLCYQASSNPWQIGIWLSNLIGAYLIGVSIVLIDKMALPQEFKLLVVTGFLGSLTTLSSLSLEIVQLLQKQAYLWAMTVLALHLILALALTAIGIYSTQALIKAFY